LAENCDGWFIWFKGSYDTGEKIIINYELTPFNTKITSLGAGFKSALLLRDDLNSSPTENK
jgi:hypothetical protein